MCVHRWCRTLIKGLRPPALWLLAALLPGPLAAAPYDREYDEPAPWIEDVKALPALPQEDDLIALAVDGPQRNFKHYIDGKSVTAYADSVITYTVVIISDSGVKNIFFEGMRCDMGRYKTYAYGSGDGAFQQSQSAAWQRVRTRNGPTNYRSDLLRYYLCSADGSPLKPEQVIERLKHPQIIPSRNNG